MIANPASTLGPSRLSSWRRRLLHGLAIGAGWLLFAWAWRRATAGAPDLGELAFLVLGAALTVPVLTLVWMAHNLGIHRRRGARRAVPPADMRYEVDFNGRRVEADWAVLTTRRRIVIEIDGMVKRYREEGRVGHDEGRDEDRDEEAADDAGRSRP